MSIKLKLAIIGKEIFEVSLIGYLGLLVVESIRIGFVSYFFNLNYLLLVVLVSGILMVVFEPSQVQKRIKQMVQQGARVGRRLIRRKPFDGIVLTKKA